MWCTLLAYMMGQSMMGQSMLEQSMLGQSMQPLLVCSCWCSSVKSILGYLGTHSSGQELRNFELSSWQPSS